MKKLILLLVSLLVMSASGFSQNTLEFMGIPVDGTKEEMIKSLEEKGFIYNLSDDVLYGEFNGKDVEIDFQTVKDKVWILILSFTSTSNSNTIQTYNELFSLLYNDDNYIYYYGEEIDNNEDLRYNLKRDENAYNAVFFQKGTGFTGFVWYKIFLWVDGDLDVTLYYRNENNATSGEDL